MFIINKHAVTTFGWKSALLTTADIVEMRNQGIPTVYKS